MRSAYIVSYDISDQKRLRKVYKIMQGFGEHIQYSVFKVELLAADKVRMIAKLSQEINNNEDQILIVDLGPANGRGSECIESVGKIYTALERLPVVI